MGGRVGEDWEKNRGRERERERDRESAREGFFHPLREHKLLAKLAKCSFFEEQLRYLHKK